MATAVLKRNPALADDVRTPFIRNSLKSTWKVFDRLLAYSYLDELDREDFRVYRDLFVRLLSAIDRRIAAGVLRPVELRDFPMVVRFPGYVIDAVLFIGSFDPFQMTHLAMALQCLASEHCSAPLVFVVPEGHDNPGKPRKNDYRYRFDLLRMQLQDIFEPLIVPLDIGQGADTIEIVRRFIGMFPGARVRVTHLLGSDVLPFAARMLPTDLDAWRDAAREVLVDFGYRAFVVQRAGFPVTLADTALVGNCAVDLLVDDHILATPSSSDFREHQAFSIVFPTESVVRHLEVLFRYNLNRPWRGNSRGPAVGGRQLVDDRPSDWYAWITRACE
jgi:nicotinic acid mononucleotide adenylyltransferase